MNLGTTKSSKSEPKRYLKESPAQYFLYFCIMMPVDQQYKSNHFFAKKYINLIFISILLVFGGINWHCKSGQTEQSQKELALLYTDTLQIYLDNTTQQLTYTLEELEERKLYIDSNLIDIDKNEAKKQDPHTVIMIDQYKMLSVKYASILPIYKKIILLREDRVIKVKSMIKAINEGFYEGKYDFFKKEYQKLLAETASTFMEAQNLNNELKTLEPMYFRLEKELNQ